MSIPVTCPGCQSVFQVADHLAGREGGCPKCETTMSVPLAPPPGANDGFELLSDGYELDDSDAIGDAIVGQAQAAPTPALPDRAAPAPPSDAAPVALTHAGAPTPAWQPLLSKLKGPLLALAALIGLLAWWMLSPTPALQILSVQPVYTVPALTSGSRDQTTATPQAAPTYSVGQHDQLIVAKPDNDGDHVLIRISLQQTALENYGAAQSSRSTLTPHAFELRRSSADPGSGSTPQLVREHLTQPVRIHLSTATTSNHLDALPPVTPDDQLIEKSRGAITATYDYALGNTRGQLIVNAQHAWHDISARNGLAANGQLTTTHPKGGPQVNADYRGNDLHITWDPASQGHWVTDQWSFNTPTSPQTRHTLALVFQRPADAGRYTLSYGEQDLATLDLDRMKQPSAPVPSPIASNRPGGPQPKSKTATGLGAYVDIVRDTRGRAQGLVSANNMRSIAAALQIYRDQNRNRFPDSLVDLIKVMPGLEASMTNPRTGDNPGFIYEKPDRGASDTRTPVVWESYQGQKDPNGAILYGDGNIR